VEAVRAPVSPRHHQRQRGDDGRDQHRVPAVQGVLGQAAAHSVPGGHQRPDRVLERGRRQRQGQRWHDGSAADPGRSASGAGRSARHHRPNIIQAEHRDSELALSEPPNKDGLRIYGRVAIIWQERNGNGDLVVVNDIRQGDYRLQIRVDGEVKEEFPLTRAWKSERQAAIARQFMTYPWLTFHAPLTVREDQLALLELATGRPIEICGKPGEVTAPRATGAAAAARRPLLLRLLRPVARALADGAGRARPVLLVQLPAP